MRAPMLESSINDMRRHPEFGEAIAAHRRGESVDDYAKKIANDLQYAEDNVLLVIKAGFEVLHY